MILQGNQTMAKGNQNSEKYQEFAKGLRRGFQYRLKSKFLAYINKWPLYTQTAGPKKKKEDSFLREDTDLQRNSSPSKQFDLHLRETHRIEEGAAEDEASASQSRESMRDLNDHQTQSLPIGKK